MAKVSVASTLLVHVHWLILLIHSSAGRSGIDQWNFVNRPDDGKARDPSGNYVRKWCPELKHLPTKHLCKPFMAPAQVLEKAGVILGSTYPFPIIPDLNKARSITEEFTLSCRRQAQEFNDAQGYDYVELQDFTRRKVFTKKEFRIDKAGNQLYPPGNEKIEFTKSAKRIPMGNKRRKK